MERSQEHFSIEIAIRARYAETDAMGVVHHASYVIWLEQGRTELLRARGLSYRQIEADGFFVVLSDLRVRYHAAARYDDLVLLRATLEDARSRQLSFAYELRLGDSGARLVSARSEHVILSRATGRPTRLPAQLLAALRQADEATIDSE
ncbi:MAG TPA: thioesterase family protein [Roseiflexaceae bacterium]|nr:thioesterase family protein [Roseiflexaceae bacterium]